MQFQQQFDLFHNRQENLKSNSQYWSILSIDFFQSWQVGAKMRTDLHHGFLNIASTQIVGFMCLQTPCRVSSVKQSVGHGVHARKITDRWT